MSTKQKSPILKRIISLILLLLWMGLIFFFSHQNATESDNVSGGLIEIVVNFLLPHASADTVAGFVSGFNFIVRKCAHFTLYAVLGFLSFLTVITYEKLFLTVRVILSLLIGLLYAVSDEFHQTFIPGRSGQLRDVCIDFSGVLLAVLLSLTVYKLHKYIKNRKVSPMRKKQYIELTDTLQKELHKAKLTVDELREENRDLKTENSALNSELHELRAKLADIEAQAVCDDAEETASAAEEEIPEENSPEAEVNIPDDMAYGAEIIGKIVLSAANCCNSLTAVPTNGNVKELVNLILGRTEVAKSEILKIVALDIDRQSKIAAMEKERSEAEDYFKSVMAQK